MKLKTTALYYRSHPEARKRRLEQQTAYESSEQQRAYRSKLSVLRRKKHLKGSKMDLSHTKSGKIVLENRSANRRRNGADGESTLK